MAEASFTLVQPLAEKPEELESSSVVCTGSAVKGCAIWTTSAKEFCEGSHDLVLGFAGTYTARRHDRIMADLLERLVEEGWS